MQPIKRNSSFEPRKQKKSLRDNAFVYTVYSLYQNESKQAVLLKLDPFFCVYYRKGLHLYVVKYDLNHLGNDSSDKKKIPSNISFTEVP